MISQTDRFVKVDDIIESVDIKAHSYVPNTNSVKIAIPKTSNHKISMSVGNNNISMAFPDVIENTYGTITESGSIIYKSDNNVNVVVQTIEKKLKQNEFRNAVRTMIYIENDKAPKEYHFTYDLPKGYHLVRGNELGNSEIPNDGVGIINEEGYAVAFIDSPWAKDADGEDIHTYYKIKGDVLIQSVEFDDNTKFPIIADPTTIVDTRTESKTYMKTTGFHLIEGQSANGYSFKTGGGIGWYAGTGTSKSMSISATYTKQNLMVNFKVGSTKESTSGELRFVTFPASTVRKKAWANHDLKVVEKKEDYKYRTTTVTDNGKTTTTTYKWVTVRNWVDKVTDVGSDYELRKV